MQFLCRRMVKGLRTVTFRWENATMLRRVFGIRHGRRGVSAKSRFADSGRSVINDNCLLVLLASRFCERLRVYRVSCAYEWGCVFPCEFIEGWIYVFWLNEKQLDFLLYHAPDRLLISVLLGIFVCTVVILFIILCYM